MVDGERALQKVGVQADHAADAAGRDEDLLVEKQTARGQLELAVADAGRALGRHGVELARAREQLDATRAELAAVSGELDHALLARDVASLNAEQAACARSSRRSTRRSSARGRWPRARSA